MHAGGYLAAEHDAIDLSNYEANTDHFPVLFRAETNPYAVLGRGIELQPACVNLNESGRVRVDYVLMWGDLNSMPGNACADELRRELRKWELVGQSKTGFGHLWKRRM
jgi:hypothetical protein